MHFNADSAMPLPVAKRFRLTFSLRTFLVVTLLLSAGLGYFGRRWWQAYRNSQPPTLHELAQIAKRHGIPMPPREAKFVAALEAWSMDGLKGYYLPGFLLREDEKEIVLLCGTEEKTFEKPDAQPLPVAWREFPAKPVTRESDGYVIDIERSSAFVSAVQLYAAGDRQRASELFRLVMKADVGDGYDIRIEPANLRHTMARCAYGHIAVRLSKEPQRWPELRTQLELLLDEFPALKEELPGRTYRSLTLAVDAPPARAGSVEALLIDWSRRPTEWPGGYPFDWFAEHLRDDPDDASLGPAREILLRGFDAVPDLIALRDDQRLAFQTDFSEDDGTPRFRLLGDLALDVLKLISGFERSTPLSVPVSDEEDDPTAAQWIAWFTQAKAQGEREYLLANLFEQKRDNRGFLGMHWNLMHILAEKHPVAIRGLCERYFEASEPVASASAIAEAVSVARLPLADRVELTVKLLEHAPPAERHWVIWHLAKLDQQRAKQAFLPMIQQISEEPKVRYVWCREAEIAAVVTRFDDDEVWRSIVQALHRVSPGLRVEMLQRLIYRSSEETYPHTIAVLAAFLDDKSVRDASADPERHKGSWLADTYPAFPVGDYAAFELGPFLGIPREAPGSPNPSEWPALREQVRQRLAQEKLPDLE
jgi:hypothetical protein